MTDDIPQDTREVLREETVGVNQDVEFRFTMTTEQAEDLLMELDALSMDHLLDANQRTLQMACRARLAQESRNTDMPIPAVPTIQEQHKELHDYINFQRMRGKHGA